MYPGCGLSTGVADLNEYTQTDFLLDSSVDPASVLEHAIQLQKKAQKVQDLEMENRQLRDRLEEYNSEFAEVKNQGICSLERTSIL